MFMNFKLKQKKLVTSLIITAGLWILLWFVNSQNNTGFLSNLSQLHNYDYLLSSGNLIIFIIEAVIVFVILSLFQSKHAV